MQVSDLEKNRKQKHISISEKAIEYIKEYADLNGIDFSHAIESLALQSIDNTRMLGELALQRVVIRREIAAQYNRVAKLIAHCAIEAGAAKQAAETIYWMLLKDESIEYFDQAKEPTLAGLASRFGVNPKSLEGAVLIDLFKQKKDQFRTRSVTSIRKPIEEYREFLELLEVLEDETRFADLDHPAEPWK